MNSHNKGVLLLLEGGHKTYVKGYTVTEVERMVSEARNRKATLPLDPESQFVYLQNHRPEQESWNELAVDATQVVAIVAAYTSRPDVAVVTE